MGNWKLAICLAAVLALVAPAAAQTKDTLSVDLPGDAATLDPHVQWDTDSYTIYRNIFDNLLTRDAAGKIVPQIGASWRYVSDTVIDFDIRTATVRPITAYLQVLRDTSAGAA